MKKIILATTNKGKIKELLPLLQPYGIELLSIDQLDQSMVPDVVEDGETFEANALKKAKAFYEQFGIPCLADDSGLEVDYLDGAPGIYSARYAGEGKSDQANVQKLLEVLQGVPSEERAARFTCAISYVDGNHAYTALGHCPGYITEEPQGENGFGYDPVFWLPTLNCTMAQLTKEEKNKISHRYRAMENLLKEYQNIVLD